MSTSVALEEQARVLCSAAQNHREEERKIPLTEEVLSAEDGKEVLGRQNSSCMPDVSGMFPQFTFTYFL